MLVEKYGLDNNCPQVDVTAYILDDSPELLNGKKRPAIIICPGGAYLFCSDREGEAVALRFAAMGYHAFVLRYHVQVNERLALEEAFQKGIVPREDTVFPAQIRDIAKVFTLLHDKEEEWLVDTDKIALCGFSAGGNNVTNYAVHWNKSILTNEFNKAKLQPAAVIAGYPVTDYISHQEAVRSQDEMSQALFKTANRVFFGTSEPTADQLLQASSACLVDEATPPMFIWATAGDRLVGVDQSTRLATALAIQKIPFELHIFEEGEHGLALATQATARKASHIDSAARRWIDLAEIWLEKRFALPLED
ncbi:acetyl esterase/lipase [Streptococcus rupicaprae]|uniref:Acetyl esterase/lipase n=1 Tax=Streptococcus rupicaprae TaxID=759619 RepID=A0ABV2FI05_9STRE